MSVLSWRLFQLKNMALSFAKQPFEYSIRVSARARHVRLAVKPYHGLEVVIPKRFPRKQIPRILQQHQVWITDQLQKHHQLIASISLPKTIELLSTGDIFTVEYENGQSTRVTESNNHLKLGHTDQGQALKILRQWVRKKARQILIPQLELTALEFDFHFIKTSIRSQKSRWGSCSSRGTISLNDQLLFMPVDTVRYLMIHELCHTRCMNHSAEFWTLVERCCPEFRQHEKTLAMGREFVPEWFRYSLFSGL